MSRVDTPLRDDLSTTVASKLARLIAEQGVKPIGDIDELADQWPADDDPDALMNFLLSERRARNLPTEGQQPNEHRPT